MSFDHPWVLLCLTTLVPMALAGRFSPRNKRIKAGLPANLWAKLLRSRIFFRLFFAFAVIALAGPRWGIGQVSQDHRLTVDAVIALDISRSMELADGNPDNSISRLGQGLAIVREAVAALPEMRFGIAISRNRGILAIPLTWDNSTVLAFLEAVDGSSITGRGTNLEALLDASAGAFQTSHHAARVIILVSDGEELSGSLRASLGRRNREQITVTAVAVGSDEGMPVPGEDGVISRRDANAMRLAAVETGGVFIDGNHANAAHALTAYLRSLTGSVFFAAEGIDAGGEQKDRWLLFALLALAAFGLSKLSLLRIRNSTPTSPPRTLRSER